MPPRLMQESSSSTMDRRTKQLPFLENGQVDAALFSSYLNLTGGFPAPAIARCVTPRPIYWLSPKTLVD